MYTYLLINILTLLSTFIFSFETRINYFSKWKKYLVSTTIVAIFMLIWDYMFTELGVWGFSDEYLSGIFFGPLPLEEVLFFFTIPYSSLFIYEVTKYALRNRKISMPGTVLLILGIVSIIFGNAHLDKLYTSTTFIFLGVLSISVYLLKPQSLSPFLISFLITIIPFFIVNGILTNGIPNISPNPVVWYNNSENLNIRLETIPVEDIFYGLFMLMANYFIYERFLNVRQKN